MRAAWLNTDDDVSLLRIINTRRAASRPPRWKRRWSRARGPIAASSESLSSPAFRAGLTTRTCNSIQAFADFLDGFETRLNEPLSDHVAILRELIAQSGYLEELRRSCKTPEEALQRENNVVELMKSFEGIRQTLIGGLRGFLDEMMLRQERLEDSDEAKGSGVTLITLHAAKGLEFPQLYLIGLEEGLLPHDRSKVEGTVDEERRLLYVGTTRARQTLMLTWCNQRIKYGSASPCALSSFAKEFDPAWVLHRSLKQIMNAPVPEATVKNRFEMMRALLSK